MEVRLLSVGTRGFFLPASRLAIAASPLNSVAPNEKKTSGTRVTVTVHVRYKSWYISLPSAQQQREMTNTRTKAEFRIFIWN